MNSVSHMAAKSHQNKMLIFVLLAAFLSMQWSTAHIHLAEHHNHDESHHQHTVEAHAHQSITPHNNSNDSTHQESDHSVSVIELDHVCDRQSGDRLDNHTITSIPANFELILLPQQSSIKLPKVNTFKHRYIDYSTLQLRAPPKYS